MKKNQSMFLKFIHLLFLFLCLSTAPLYGHKFDAVQEKADSLFLKKHYTQSFSLYKKLFDQNIYSRSMLLKMAFIQEGLGQIAWSLYYLNLYYLVSGNKQVLEKIGNMTKKGDLYGYDFDTMVQFRYALQRSYIPISIALGVLVLIVLGILWYQKRLSRNRPYLTGLSLILVLSLLFAHIYFSDRIEKGIVTSRVAYLMEAPSAGASVLDVIAVGNQVTVSGQKDVWLHVKWLDRTGYIKQDKLALVGIR